MSHKAQTARRWSLGVLATALSFTLAVSGCAGSGAPVGGGNFDFVSPGGKTDLFYDPPTQRGTVGPMSGPDLMVAGKTTSLSDFAGDVVVINLWGQWCGPCRAEAPQLEQVLEATRSKGVRFLGINVRDPEKDKARDFVSAYKISYPSIWDPSMRTLIALGGRYPTSVIPSTLVLDRHHRVAAVFLRALLANDLQPVVQRVAAE
ncbi:TlpA family protein disulfide reductase [Skermania sp. ID1734]|uniref:TlpA disulfide reductase family protein n=1 Tax=Skermania sp. ID1734 TaxID=2597516 RepID=UPI00117D3923|nr:TlpA disulfide reductase family protein [Skermania sp. ID1734]TSD93797.1 TlpA family protein disulfide reductase [Skermania sp. ID1734]